MAELDIDKKYNKAWKSYKKRESIGLSTGSLKLNKMIGKLNGYPKGSIIELYGYHSAGKSTMAYLAIAEAQRKYPDKLVGFIDAENSFHYQADHAAQMGVDLDRLLVRTITSGEEAFNVLETSIYGITERDKDNNPVKVIDKGNFSLIVVDSVSQLIPVTEVQKEMEDSQRQGAIAGLMGRGIRKLVSAMVFTETDTSVIFINQVRDAPGMYGRAESRPGGKALGFYATLILGVTKDFRSVVYEDGRAIGHRVVCRIDKNKTDSLDKEPVDFFLWTNGKGIDINDELLDLGIKNGLITRAGSWSRFTMNEPDDEDIPSFNSNTFSSMLEKYPHKREKLLSVLDNGNIFTKALTLDEIKMAHDEAETLIETLPPKSVLKKPSKKGKKVIAIEE